MAARRPSAGCTRDTAFRLRRIGRLADHAARRVNVILADPAHVFASETRLTTIWGLCGHIQVTTIPSGWNRRGRGPAISPWRTTAAGAGRLAARDLPPRGRDRHVGEAATSKGRCRGAAVRALEIAIQAYRRAHRGRRSTRKGGGGKCSPIGGRDGRRRTRCRRGRGCRPAARSACRSSRWRFPRVVRPAHQVNGRRS